MVDHFFLFFASLWLGITTVLGVLSGWFLLMFRYPDQYDGEPLLVLKWQSGTMGLGANMNGILKLSACRSGLRVGMLRIFGPFCRDFFVPWSELTVTRKKVFFWDYAELRFGQSFPKLGLSGRVADKLWAAVPDGWPEGGSPPAPETRDQAVRDVVKKWALTTAVASAFFIIVPRVTGAGDGGMPVPVAILFPAIVFGIGWTFEYWLRRR